MIRRKRDNMPGAKPAGDPRADAAAAGAADTRESAQSAVKGERIIRLCLGKQPEEVVVLEANVLEANTDRALEGDPRADAAGAAVDADLAAVAAAAAAVAVAAADAASSTPVFRC